MLKKLRSMSNEELKNHINNLVSKTEKAREALNTEKVRLNILERIKLRFKGKIEKHGITYVRPESDSLCFPISVDILDECV